MYDASLVFGGWWSVDLSLVEAAGAVAPRRRWTPEQLSKMQDAAAASEHISLFCTLGLISEEVKRVVGGKEP